jgi:hypothetical protein
MVMLVSTGYLHLISASKTDQETLLKPHPDGYVGFSKIFLIITVRLSLPAIFLHEHSNAWPTTPIMTKGKRPLLS